jgi:integrase
LAHGASGLFFGRTPDTPFRPTSVAKRAARAWKDAGLQPITLHEARHTFASMIIAARVNAKALST